MREPKEIVLHIGPPKTASTTFQRRLAEHRQELAAHGTSVIVEHRDAAIELIGRDYLHVRNRTNTAHSWSALQQAVASANGHRVIISNELFAWLDQASTREMLNAFTGNSIRVVLSMRRLDRLIFSFWHEIVIRGETYTLPEWVEALRSVDGNAGTLDDPAFRFWHSEDPASLTRRWSELIGHDRVTCVVISEQDPITTLRRIDEAFELTPFGAASATRVENQSASFEHLNALAKFNRTVAKFGLPKRVRRTLARYAHEQLIVRGGGPRVTSQFSHEDLAWCAQRQDRSLNDVRARGVRVVGELSDLVVPDKNTTDRQPRLTPINVNAFAIASRVVRTLVRRLAGK